MKLNIVQEEECQRLADAHGDIYVFYGEGKFSIQFAEGAILNHKTKLVKKFNRTKDKTCSQIYFRPNVRDHREGEGKP